MGNLGEEVLLDVVGWLMSRREYVCRQRVFMILETDLGIRKHSRCYVSYDDSIPMFSLML